MRNDTTHSANRRGIEIRHPALRDLGLKHRRQCGNDVGVGRNLVGQRNSPAYVHRHVIPSWNAVYGFVPAWRNVRVRTVKDGGHGLAVR